MSWVLEAEWRFWVALLGVLVAIIAIVFGFVAGEIDKMFADPEVRAKLERRKKERDRQQAWKDKFK